ncbi:MAG: terminase small subunit [Desulfovibrio sp.]|jgi:hypothetical protein|nr:terminase small subunit [Desulfovibrio sp.]
MSTPSETNIDAPEAKPKVKQRRKRIEPATHDGKHAGHEPHQGKGLDEPDSFLMLGDNTWDADDPDKPLTEQQFVLVHEYMVDMDFAAAMKRAGYRGERNGSRLKNQPNIKKAIFQLLQERKAACRVYADKVLAQLVRIIDLSVADFLDWKGTEIRLKGSASIPEEKKALLVEIRQGKGGGWSIKMPDKLAAIDKVMRHLGMFENANRHMQMPDPRKAEIIRAVRDGKLTVEEAILDLDAEGLPIPESFRILASRRKAEDNRQLDDGRYAVPTPEEMAEKRKLALEGIQKQLAEFLPERQAEVAAIKEEFVGPRPDSTHIEWEGNQVR